MNARSGEGATGFLLAAIEDRQGTIRALDVKAEILAAFVGLVAGGAITLTPTAAVLAQDPTGSHLASVLGTVALVACALAIVAIGLTVYPRTAPAVPLGACGPTGAFFPLPTTFGIGDASKLAATASTTDWTAELSFELLKLSAIRRNKARYFVFALWLTGAASLLFAVAAIAQRV